MRGTLVATIMTMVLALTAGLANATTASVSMTFTINPPPVTTTKDGDLSLTVYKNAAKTSYVDTDVEWGQPTPAKIRAQGEGTTTFSTVSTPATIALTSGSETATLDVACRATNNGSYAASKSDGADCGTPPASDATGYINLAIFPTGITFTGANAAGTYTGTSIVTVVY